MMFSLTFFGREEEMIKLCNTLTLLKNDGLFVTAYMDGEKTLQKFKENNGVIQGSFYKITDTDYNKTINQSLWCKRLTCLWINLLKRMSN